MNELGHVLLINLRTLNITSHVNLTVSQTCVTISVRPVIL